MHLQPRLVPTSEPDRPEGVVVVLHGGASRGEQMMVSPTQLSVLRMVPIARRIARAGRGRLATYRLLNSYRGWDTHHTPVDDARWAMRQVTERYGDVPVCLVGHSLGGRAALLAGDHDNVASVVALNPWVYPTDRADLTGRRVLIAHGDADRIAVPSRAQTVARTLARTTDVAWLTVQGGKHAMLNRARVFEGAAADWATATLLGRDVGGPVSRLLAGERSTTV
ncbi:alpha/beta hydrolase [Nocardioides marmoribigeumensis]|uniref:Dienelactone hydrolase n=1 Tax=Nocardioides marmoribigeumensis TaxID=433649 RepID=A0ABU2BQ94_9ACTN|nr:alpha/beta fold hydrolase [Nocardioides marmoribigeumensis]MDR7360812.1 dienelactone hydrolase [Nocardioides marmoribigeumensis]